MESLVEKILSVVNGDNEEVVTGNANKSTEVFSTQRDLIAGEAAKYIAHNYLLPKHLSEAHLEGKIHIHDLDYAPLSGQSNCCLINLDDMLTNGFKMNGVEITTPTNINTAMTLASQIVMAVASCQYGGISFDRFDEVLEKYVTMTYNKHLLVANNFNIQDKEDYAHSRTEKDVYDACQTFEYQVNSMTCTSGQTPFITIGFGLGASWEAKLLQECILKIRIGGLGEHKTTAIFPKLIYSIKDGVNHKKDDPNYDIKQLAVECSSKRLYPDILNYDQVVDVTGSFKASMGCRSFLSKLEKDGKEIHSGRSNLGVVTINLPMVAMEAGSVDNFYQLLEEYLGLAKEVCEFRLDYLSKVKAKSAPILYQEGGLLRLQPDELVLPHLIDRGSSISVGYIGINETVNALLEGDHLLHDKNKQKLAIEILEFFNEKVTQFKEESGVGYSVYATPSESQCKRLRDAAYNKFGEVSGVTDKEYFTNSFHLEASMQTDPYTRMDFERQFISLSAGGFISYSELPDMKNNLQALEDLWDFSYNVTPYYAINTPVDVCFECNFGGTMDNTSRGFRCKRCGNTDQRRMYVIRRVSGYLGNPNSRPFNKGKMQECNDRKINQ